MLQHWNNRRSCYWVLVNLCLSVVSTSTSLRDWEKYRRDSKHFHRYCCARCLLQLRNHARRTFKKEKKRKEREHEDEGCSGSLQFHNRFNIVICACIKDALRKITRLTSAWKAVGMAPRILRFSFLSSFRCNSGLGTSKPVMIFLVQISYQNPFPPLEHP